MKFLATVLIALWSLPVFSFSLTDFAAIDNADKAGGFIFWQGKGTLTMSPNGERNRFLSALTMRNLGNHLILFDYRVVLGDTDMHLGFIAQVEDKGFFTTYTCNEDIDKAIADNKSVSLSNCKKNGWGYTLNNSMYFDYIASDGVHYMHHYSSYFEGHDFLSSTGSMGTAAEGLILTWTENLRHIFVHRP